MFWRDSPRASTPALDADQPGLLENALERLHTLSKSITAISWRRFDEGTPMPRSDADDERG